MHWLLQDSFHSDKKYNELISLLERYEIPFTLVKVIPFSDDGIESDIDLNELSKTTPIYTYGSYTLSKIAVKNGFTPGAFISDQFTMNNMKNIFGDDLFNNDMIIDELGKIKPVNNEFFIRPLEDSKSFVAGVMQLDEFNKFQEKIINANDECYSTVLTTTEVMISSIKEIQGEYRFYIIDNKLVTGCQYKFGEVVRYDSHVDQYIIDYVNSQIGKVDCLAYCLDIAVSNNVPKVLEINNINSSGLYALDLNKYIDAIENLGWIYFNKTK